MSASGAYLLAYNAVQLLGWTYILIAACLELPEAAKTDDLSKMWYAVKTPMRIFQTLMLLEVVHASVGIVRSSAWNNLLQIASRVFIMWAIYAYVLESKTAIRGTNTPAVALLIFPWAITEILRYSYYILYVFNSVPYWLTWCRYSFFVLMYPLGVTGEVLSIWRAASYLQKTAMFRELTTFGIAGQKVQLAWLLYASLGLYLIFFPKLYTHMFKQREKVLGRFSTNPSAAAVTTKTTKPAAARKEKSTKAQ